MRDTVPELDRVVEDEVHPPLEATQSGFASVSRALQDETIHATERAELLAVPLLLLVLLLVFRSLAAALIPLLFGALTVLAGRGVLVLLTSVMTIDAISLVVCTMMGLALGVDYSLLIVSRFREELAEGRPPYEAAMRSRAIVLVALSQHLPILDKQQAGDALMVKEIIERQRPVFEPILDRWFAGGFRQRLRSG